MNWKKSLVDGGIFVAKQVTPGVVDLGAKIGVEIIEHQKSLIRIPDLKDVLVDEALRILKDELNLTPTSAIANPNVAYADESENEVVQSDPKFGVRVAPKTAVKIYYLTQEVIDKSKKLLEKAVQEFRVPEVIGLNIYEAREDLEGLGLKVTEKLEKPSLEFVNKEDGQVTRVTYPNDHKIGSKLKTGDRISLYYVNEEVISESIALKDKKDQDKQERIDKIGKITKDVSKAIYTGAAKAPHNIAKSIKNPFNKKEEESDMSTE